MQVLGNRSRLSPCRSASYQITASYSTPYYPRYSLARASCAQPSASLRQSADLAKPQSQAAAAPEAVARSRRQALGLLGGSALTLSAARELAAPAPALAALKDYKLDPNDPIEEVAIQLGTEDGEFVFVPNTIELTAGKIYKLKLRNPSAVTHYFTAFEFAEKSYSIMVLAGDPVVEVKGGIQEVALKAGAAATWVVMPVKPGRYPLRCTVKGHEGMTGQILVKRPQ